VRRSASRLCARGRDAKKNKRGKKSKKTEGKAKKKVPNGLVAYVPWLATSERAANQEPCATRAPNTQCGAQLTPSVGERKKTLKRKPRPATDLPYENKQMKKSHRICLQSGTWTSRQSNRRSDQQRNAQRQGSELAYHGQRLRKSQ
jgi:hypothetical protein